MATEQQSRKLAAVITEHSEVFKHLSNEDAQWAIQNGTKASAIIFNGLQGAAKADAAFKNSLSKRQVKQNSNFRLLSGAVDITLDPTDGEEIIARSDYLFTGHLDRDFLKYGTEFMSPSTEEMNVAVYEMIKDGTLAQIFGGLSNDLHSLCLTQPQIIKFIIHHREWLRTDGYGTFFLFKSFNKAHEEFFVAYVNMNEVGRLRAYAYRFSHGCVWRAYHHRLVVPQITPKS